MKELPYFRFYPAEWKAGKISAFGATEQGIYLNMCILAWMKGGEFEIENELFSKQMEVTPERLAEIIDKFLKFKILVYANAMQNIYMIKFVEQQFQASKHLSKIRAKSAEKRWRNPPQNDAKAMQSHAKTDDKDKDKDKDKEGENAHTRDFFVEYPKTWEEVKQAAETIGYDISQLEAENFLAKGQSKGWKDGKSNIMDWRKLLMVWKNSPRRGGTDPDWMTRPPDKPFNFGGKEP